MGSQFLRLVYLLLLTLVMIASAGCGGGSGGDNSPTSSTPNVVPVPERITFSGSGDLGIFDPSVTRDTVSGRWWMSYSSVNTSIYYSPLLYWSVSIRLAYSDDDGVSWQDAGVAVAPKVETLVGPMTEANPDGDIPAGSKGIWQSETSSLIYDPSAPTAERWKLVWFQYLNANSVSYFADYSWIAMKMAATPLELATATPVKLFGGIGLQPQNSVTGAPVFSPTAGAPAIKLNTDIPQVIGGSDVNELDWCVFTEPGLHATSSDVYLTIFCADVSTILVTGDATKYIVHFRCGNPCNMTNAASWKYLGRLLSPTDALAATGDDHYQAPSVVEKNGKTYLIVTPVDTTLGQQRYNGCRVYEFGDVSSNQLLRDSDIQLIEVARIDGDVDTHNGACDVYSGLEGGVLLSQFGIVGTADAFKIYKSQVRLP